MHVRGTLIATTLTLVSWAAGVTAEYNFGAPHGGCVIIAGGMTEAWNPLLLKAVCVKEQHKDPWDGSNSLTDYIVFGNLTPPKDGRVFAQDAWGAEDGHS